MTNRRVTSILWVTCALVAVAGCWEEPPEVVEQVRSIKTFIVTELASGQTRKYSGIVQATDSSALSFQVSGNVQAVRVNLGDRVTEGQVLAVLDKKPYELDVQAAEAELRRARAELDQKKLDYNRQKTLYEKGWVSKAAFDQAVAAKESAEGDVTYAVSKLNLAKRDLRLTTLTAPFAGLIAKRSVDRFVEVAAGQKLFEINAEGAVEVAFDIPETTISQITLGMPASVGFSTAQDCVCEGRITEIGSVAGEANAYPVKAALIDPPPTVRAGMTAEVTIVLRDADQDAAYMVPLVAIAPGEEPRQGYVFVYDVKASTVQRTLVRGRGATDNMVAIYEGVQPGDIVAVAGVSFLTDGQKVKLMNP